MAKRPLSAAQLQHNRDVARKGGLATKAKYGGWHFAHAARSAKARGTYTPPTIRTPFAGLRARAKTTSPVLTTRVTPLGRVNPTTSTKTVSSGSLLPRSTFSASTFANTTRKTRRKPAVR